jgi:hypothetical protein
MTQSGAYVGAFVLYGILSVVTGCGSETAISQELPPGVVIKLAGMDARHTELAAFVKSAAAKVMSQPGLVGVMGGAHVRLLKSGTHEILLPLPQLADGQVPVCYYIHSTPQGAATEYRLKERDHSNVIVSVRLQGDRDQEVQIDWSAVVLVTGKMVSPNGANPDSYRPSSACVQSESKEIKKLAQELWPPNNQVKDYAGNVQRFVREMKQRKPPRTLDALGILDSGANGICTANANLALALLRKKGIASRSMAVIPPTSQRLEMHRIVEYAEDNQWLAFDPSSLHADVPMKPWQSVIMAKTTIADENLAGTPRMGAMVGCPYGQELEVASAGITPWGAEFFWTIAKPLAEFQPDDEVITLATESWKQYLRNGELSPGQIAAQSAKNSTELLQSLKAK